MGHKMRRKSKGIRSVRLMNPSMSDWGGIQKVLHSQDNEKVPNSGPRIEGAPVRPGSRVRF